MTSRRSILLLFAHPALEKSRVNRRLADAVREAEGVTFHDLYERYPDFDIDVAEEQRLLASHDVLVLQHPMYWYSTPALIKQWLDLVLEHGWAYGRGGTALRGKLLLNVVTTGGGATGYRQDGDHGHTVGEFLVPLSRSARLCGIDTLPPFVVFGTHAMPESEIEGRARDYRRILGALHRGSLDLDAARRFPTLGEGLDEILQD